MNTSAPKFQSMQHKEKYSLCLLCVVSFFSYRCASNEANDLNPDTNTPITVQDKIDNFNASEIENKKPMVAEGEILKIQDFLLSAHSKVSTYRQLVKYNGNSSFNLTGLEAFERAKQNFQHNNYLPVISLLNTYLDSVQIIDKSKYIESQWMLAKCYQNLGNDIKSFKAYNRFINESIKQNISNTSMFTESIKESFKIIRKLKNNQLLENLVSGLAATNMTLEVYNEVIPLVAIEAANLGHFQTVHILTSSLERKNRANDDAKIKVKILYIRALSLLYAGNIKLAREFLEYIVNNYNHQEIKSHSYLLLGRIHAQFKSWDRALEYYNLVSASTPYFKKASIEKLRVLIESQQYSKARSDATAFLAAWPDEKDSYQLRLNLIYLDLSAGDLDEAENSIKKVIERLHNLKSKITSTFIKQGQFSFDDLKRISEITSGSIENNSFIEECISLYTQIISQRRLLFDHHNSLRDIYYKIATSKSNIINNEITNRTHALSFIADSLINSGFKLAKTQESMLQKYASQISLKKMQINRENLSEAMSQISYLADSIKENDRKVALLGLLKTSSLLSKQIYLTDAKLKGAYMSATMQGKDSNKGVITGLSSVLKDQKLQLIKLQDEIRKKQAEILLRSGNIENFEKHLLKKLLLLHDSQETILKSTLTLKDLPFSLREKHLKKPWEIWNAAAANLLVAIKELKQDLGKKVEDTTSRINIIEADIYNTDLQIFNIYYAILKNFADHSVSTSSSLIQMIDARILKHQRWLAEIQIRRLYAAKNQLTTFQEKHTIEKEIIDSQLEFHSLKSGTYF